MGLSLLYNIPSLAAEDQLNTTGVNLQNTLEQLSSGSRINSGADDAAGLAIADGLSANVSALNQSGLNANDTIGALQVADGSLAQVTTMLNRAVTLATESANGTVSDSQRTAIQTEFSDIITEINNIGSNTTFNGAAVFSNTALSTFMSDAKTPTTISVVTGDLSSATLGLTTPYATGTLNLDTNPADGDTVTVGTTTYQFKNTMGAANDVQIGATVQDTLNNLAAAINGTPGEAGTTASGAAYYTGTVANADATAQGINGTALTVQAVVAGTAGNGTVATGASLTGIGGWSGVDGSGDLTGAGATTADLSTAPNAQLALTAINSAIATVASSRGAIGAGINQLQAAVNVMSNQVENLTNAENNITSANIGQAVTSMSKYQILTQTGIAALAQSNTSQQAVLRLLQ